jgi:hypothetical protein
MSPIYIVKSVLVLFLLASAVPALGELVALKPIWRCKEVARFHRCLAGASQFRSAQNAVE